jgi:hypothetical protein
MKLTIERDYPDQRIRDLLTSAFEGGSNYWYQILRYEYAPGLTAADFKEGGKMQPPGGYNHPCQLVPLTEGCAVCVVDKEGTDTKVYRLDRTAIAKGLHTMSEKYPKHFADWLTEHDDADTGDCFLQCCLFGDLVYG